eukprot:2276854-Amphidinium_carterae.1
MRRKASTTTWSQLRPMRCSQPFQALRASVTGCALPTACQQHLSTQRKTRGTECPARAMQETKRHFHDLVK